MKTHKERGEKWELPDTLHFEGKGQYFYTISGLRIPLKDEWYISGAEPQAYKAPNTLDWSYLVVVPSRKAVQGTIWVQGDDDCHF